MGIERKAFIDQLKNLEFKPLDKVAIGDRLVGKDEPVLIIAEIGANHRGDIKNALLAIESAKKAGADAVKFQHMKHDKIAADTMVYEDWHGKQIGPLTEFYKTAELPYEWTSDLVKHAKKLGILFLSTPFDTEAVDILEKADVAAYKIASYELTDDILLKYIAKKGKPLLVSTGMATIEEVGHAVQIINNEGNKNIVLLHCTSMYPPRNFSDLNLRAISALQQAFKLPVGYSDHSKPPYLAGSLAAVTLGACVIEKHLTDERKGGSNDDPNSLESKDFERLVEEIRNTEKALSGSGIKQPISYSDHKGDEMAERWTRRSVYAARDLKVGDKVTEDAVITLRPWGGIDPRDIHLFLGKKLRKSIKKREPLTPEHFMD
jgi:N,N'-diacetyllegionaminate synthase